MTATPRIVDFSFDGSLNWPEERWFIPRTFDEVAGQDAIRSARAQGLTDRIEHQPTVRQLATLLRKR